jgi:hypothetical protein
MPWPELPCHWHARRHGSHTLCPVISESAAGSATSGPLPGSTDEEANTTLSTRSLGWACQGKALSLSYLQESAEKLLPEHSLPCLRSFTPSH